MNFTNIKKNAAGAMAAIVCQDFILQDEEFSNNSTVKDHYDDPTFWFEMGKNAEEAMKGYLMGEAQNEDSYTVLPLDTISFMLSPQYHPYLIDVIVNFISAYLNKFEEDE